MFSIFDGHGGLFCAKYLNKTLHQTILANLQKQGNIIAAIEKTYSEVDQILLKELQNQTDEQYSGSCSCTLLFYQNTILAINLGDSRILASYKNGQELK